MHIQHRPRLRCCAKAIGLGIHPAVLRIDVDEQRTVKKNEIQEDWNTIEISYHPNILSCNI